MDINSIKVELGKDWERYRETVISALTGDNSFLDSINRYILGSRGKEFRPMLTLLAGKMIGDELTEECYSAAAVAEILHSASLLHDDVADSSSLRHGVATVGAMFGPAAAVLSGDYWLSKAMYLLAAKCNRRILVAYSQTVSELASGELLQMDLAESLKTTMVDYYRIIRAKTASLFNAAMKSGAIACGATDEEVEAISTYAIELGLAFQIRDDIFDYSPQLKTGKKPCSDIKEHKMTLPLLKVLESAPLERAAEIREVISKVVIEEPDDSPAIKQIYEFVNAGNGLQQAQDTLDLHIANACRSLEIFSNSLAKERLTALAKYVGERVI